MPGKGIIDAMFSLRMLMENYREDQRELHCLFVDLKKAYDRVPREELWCCMRKSGMAEKYVRLKSMSADRMERMKKSIRSNL